MPKHARVHVAYRVSSTILFHSVDAIDPISLCSRRIGKETSINAKGWEPRERDGTVHHPESLHIWALPLPGDVCNYPAAWERSLTETRK